MVDKDMRESSSALPPASESSSKSSSSTVNNSHSPSPPSLTNKQKAEIANLKATLAYVNENLSIEEINQILFESLDDHNHLDKAHAIELAFAKKVKEEEK